jgi:ribosomal-protein-alanine N-acetyltransferase
MSVEAMNLGELRVRRGRASDLDAMLRLERATETAPHWAPRTYAAILGSQEALAGGVEGAALRRCLFVAESGQGLVGFAVGALQLDQVGDLESVVVADLVRRNGIGRALCGAVIEWCRAQGASGIALEVRAGSAGAIALYEGLGFVGVGRRAGYYSEPEEDALIMRLGSMGLETEL